MAYLADIFTYLNDTSVSLQGTHIIRFKCQSQMNAIHLNVHTEVSVFLK